MKTAKIVMDFLRDTDGELEYRGSLVMAAMTNNIYFSEPVPFLEELRSAMPRYSAALISAQYRDRLKSSEKNDTRQQLETILVSLANYVTAVAQGNRTILVSSGYSVTSETSTTVYMEKIENFTVEQGNGSGKLVASAERVKGALTYAFYFAMEDGDKTIWKDDIKSTPYLELTDLQPGKTYSCYLKVTGARNRTLVTDTISKTIY